MREVIRSAIVPYTAEQMYALVSDLERYPQFVPWVSAAQILERTGDLVVGRLDMQRSGIREHFTTRNRLDPPHSMTLELVEGPFKTLQGLWKFEPIGERGVKVTLTLRYEFASAMLGLLLSRTLEKNFGQLVDAFVARARTVYG